VSFDSSQISNGQALIGRVGKHKTTLDFESKQDVFAQGDKADAMFYIQNGIVKLTVKSAGGKKAVIAILRAGDLFGEGCVKGQSLRISSATTVRPSTLFRISRATIVGVIQRDAAFGAMFISHLLSRMGRIEEEFVDQIFNSSEKRLARVLLLMGGYGLNPQPQPAPMSVNQETLAEMVGTTRSRVSFFMNRFRNKGYIEYNGELHVHKALLTFLHDGPG
jgi:CRP/FNR family transcriptional regulator, cyclic AMP receptor protein